ncbi:peptidase, M48 family [Treponema primitia ZAS-2]|uniref:Peptidase, M48 family n=1 Tax=Treponema primitia (strain ATCC BAA-887 / DSM 12427 / ZAS-2) TaxID=545694 RepID=F5YPS2_TREPZ|nr:M48 family metalloprotease [Treponema primitia]AEF85389.1 peptidase, M48 family [Treponema primitia ZAS-2]
MRNFVFILILSLWVFTGPAAQSSGSGVLGLDISDAFSQMDAALAENDMSPEDFYYMGRAVAANILTRYRLYTQKPAQTLYLNTICSAITVNSPQPNLYNGYHVMILDTPELNAFATPGGHIFITRGMLEAANSEDALAAVIAHEIAHIQLNHGATLIKEMKDIRDLSNVADRAAAIATREASLNERTMLFDNSVREMVNTLIQNGYAREQEFAADTYALRLLSLAGYVPSSLVDVLNSIQKTGTSGGINGTHPSPAQRITNVQRELPRYRTQDTRSFRASRFTVTK